MLFLDAIGTHADVANSSKWTTSVTAMQTRHF